MNLYLSDVVHFSLPSLPILVRPLLWLLVLCRPCVLFWVFFLVSVTYSEFSAASWIQTLAFFPFWDLFGGLGEPPASSNPLNSLILTLRVTLKGEEAGFLLSDV